jgi:transformer-2 protein
MCDALMDGKKIRVDFSITRGPHAKTPGRYYGYEQRPPPRGYERGGPPARRRSPSPPRYGRGGGGGGRRSRSISPRRY